MMMLADRPETLRMTEYERYTMKETRGLGLLYVAFALVLVALVIGWVCG